MNDVETFLALYKDLANNELNTQGVEYLFNSLKPKVQGTGLAERFNSASGRVEKVVAIDALAHAIHQDPDSVSNYFSEGNTEDVKKALDELAGYEIISPARRINRGYETGLLSGVLEIVK